MYFRFYADIDVLFYEAAGIHAAHVILRRLRSANPAILPQTDHFQDKTAHAISSILMQDSLLALRVLQIASYARPQ